MLLRLLSRVGFFQKPVPENERPDLVRMTPDQALDVLRQLLRTRLGDMVTEELVEERSRNIVTAFLETEIW